MNESAPSLEPPAPLPAEERVILLDIVRGFALLGILIMNMPGFVTSFFIEADGSHLWGAWYDQAAETARDMLFDGKFNSMFSLLFGIGFTIQLGRMEERQPANATAMYLRRLILLLGFGVAHIVLLWNGDVLHIYAILGIFLLALRKASDRTVIGLLVASILFAPLSSVVRFLISTPETVARRVAEAKLWEASNNLAFGAGSYFDTVRERAAEAVYFYATPLNLWGSITFFALLATTMLMGFYIGRHRLYARVGELMPLIKRLQWWTLGVGLLCAAIFGTVMVTQRTPGPSPIKLLGGLAYVVCRLSLMMFYVLTIARLAETEAWRRRFSPLAIAGRMPLTNYLMQSLICCALFQGWGFGLWGKVGPALGFLLSLSIFFLIQVPLSRWWLARYRFGPMEWLWRYGTYRRKPAMRVAPLPATVVAGT